MIAASPIQDLTRRFGRNVFDLPVAAFAGIAAAFFVFAMPVELLGRLVTATGLPHLLAAAEPPLGLKARALIGLSAAGAAFGLAFLLLRLLDRAGRARPAPARESAESGPRLRRRDLHPDAPVCRPISAARDFGEPAPPRPVSGAPEVPLWLAEAELPAPAVRAPEPNDEPEQVAPEPVRDPVLNEREPVRHAEPEPLELAGRTAPSWLAEPEPRLAISETTPEHEPEADIEPSEAAPKQAPEARIATSESTPEREPAAEASLPDLMRRLEEGLARRRTRRIFAPEAQAHPPMPKVFPEAEDDRLQNAIESLQRLAGRAE